MAKTARQNGELPSVVRVAIGIVWRDQKLLICQRLPDAPLPGYWEFPGGKCEPGETDAQCAVREVEEEVGIGVKATGSLASITHTYDHATVTLMPILCQYISGNAQPIGCAQVLWITADELPNYRFPPANAPLLDRLIRDGLARSR
jgi:mutator protein MutT